jgi:putative ABC transport system permease protein
VTTIRVFLSRLLDVIVRRRREERLGEEVEAHLDLLTQDHVAQGMSHEDARRAARRAFGGIEPMKASYRDQRGLPPLDTLAQDATFAVRMMRRHPGFSLTAILVLGLGIGVNNMFFTILHAHTMRGLPIDRVDRVVSISAFDERTPARGFAYDEFEELRTRTRSLSDLVAFVPAPVVISEEGRPAERVDGAFMTGNTFSVIGRQPVLGRDFAPEDDRPGAAAVALLGRGLWESRYGSDRGVLGRNVLVNGQPAVIIGVIPDRSGFPGTAEVWLPLARAPGLLGPDKGARNLRLFGPLRDGITVEQARAEIDAIVIEQSRRNLPGGVQSHARVVPINEQYLGRLTDPVWLAFITSGTLVALISCANVATLLLMRSFHRTREIAIRASLGASRARVVRQLLIEAGVLATAGGAIGLAVSVGAVRLFRSAIPENVLPYWFDYSLDARVVLALVGVSIATVFVFGLLPAIHASRTDVTPVLKDGLHAMNVRSGRRWTTAFLAAEFALVIVLLSHLAVNIRSASPDLPSDRAVETREVLTAEIALPGSRYRTPVEREDFLRRLMTRLDAISGIAASSVATVLPMRSAEERRLVIADQPAVDAKEAPSVQTLEVAPNYFETFGLSLLRGRDFTERDGATGEAHAIINEQLVQQYFADRDPIGQRIALAPPKGSAEPPAWLTIVGVAPIIRQTSRDDAIVYAPYRGAPETAALLVRSSLDTRALMDLLKAEVRSLDAHLPLYRIQTMAEAIHAARWNGRVSSRLFLSLTCIAVVLATAGLFTVTLHAVGQRTREIGLRMALGARPNHIARVITRRVAAQLAFGFGAGLVGVRLWVWAFDSGRADISVTDPQTQLIVISILAAMAIVACALPIRRAMRMAPVDALKSGGA